MLLFIYHCYFIWKISPLSKALSLYIFWKLFYYWLTAVYLLLLCISQKLENFTAQYMRYCQLNVYIRNLIYQYYIIILMTWMITYKFSLSFFVILLFVCSIILSLHYQFPVCSLTRLWSTCIAYLFFFSCFFFYHNKGRIALIATDKSKSW